MSHFSARFLAWKAKTGRKRKWLEQDTLAHHSVLLFLSSQGSVNFKFGVLYAKDGQLTDDEMFSNGEFAGRGRSPLQAESRMVLFFP